MSRFKQLFAKKTVIGVVHFLPMLGFEGYTNQQQLFEAAKEDLIALQEGGVDGIFFENNYDLPHKIMVGHETTASMTEVITQLKPFVKVPFGISVLWNDYQAAFSIAKVTGADFIRIPVFVDDVQTDFGDIHASAKEVKQFRSAISAEDILIFTDVQVKHARMLDEDKTLETSIKQAIQSGSDAVIVTGKWTGDAPKFDDLEMARQAAGDCPVLVGSGADIQNITEILKYADGAIVSTSLKSGQAKSAEEERNLKPYSARVDLVKVKQFTDKALS